MTIQLPILPDPFGAVTTHTNCPQQFTPWSRPPYLDTATNVETVFTIAQVYAIQRDAMRAALEAAANVVEASPSYDWHRFACESAYAIRALDAA